MMNKQDAKLIRDKIKSQSQRHIALVRVKFLKALIAPYQQS